MKISKISAAIPERQIKIKDFGYGSHFLRKFSAITGIESVRVSKMQAYELAIRAITELEIDSNDVHTIIHVTQSPMYHLPATAHLFHKSFGFPANCRIIEVNQSCSGYVYGLFLAHQTIKYDKNPVLLVTSDKLSSYCPPGNKSELIFSDCATATWLEYDEIEMEFEFLTDSTIIDTLVAQNNYLRMLGEDIFSYTTDAIPKFIGPVKKHDVVVLHQANLTMLNLIEKKIGCWLPKNVHIFGNTSSNSIPLLLAHQEIKAKDVLLCGFGAGFSAAKVKVPDLEPSYLLTEV